MKAIENNKEKISIRRTLHKLLLTTRQRAFNNNMSTDIKLSIAQIPQIIQSRRYLGK